jgi:hypothetical protein
MGSERLAAHMGISAILLLAAIGGWAAFGFGVLSSRQQERVFRDQLTVALSERDRLSADLNQIRGELALVRADLEQNRQALDPRGPEGSPGGPAAGTSGGSADRCADPGSVRSLSPERKTKRPEFKCSSDLARRHASARWWGIKAGTKVRWAALTGCGHPI